MNQPAEIRDNRSAYEEAFRHFSSQVRLLQTLISHSGPDTPEIGSARTRVGEAHAAYRASRDRLVESMIHPPHRIL